MTIDELEAEIDALKAQADEDARRIIGLESALLVEMRTREKLEQELAVYHAWTEYTEKRIAWDTEEMGRIIRVHPTECPVIKIGRAV